MWRFILRRCLWLIVTVIATALIIFTILYFNPNDPARAILGTTITPAEADAFRDALGINRPYLVQLGDFMYSTFIKFDFGVSWTYQVPVFDEILSRLPRTMLIGLAAMVLNVIIGLSLGIFAVEQRYAFARLYLCAINVAKVIILDFFYVHQLLF